MSDCGAVVWMPRCCCHCSSCPLGASQQALVVLFLGTAAPLAAGSLLFHNAQDISSSSQVLTAENHQLLNTLVPPCWLYFTHVLGSVSNLEKKEAKLLPKRARGRLWQRAQRCAWSHGSYRGSCGGELLFQVAGSVFSLLNL